ncbi:hypothetical protein [Tautonia sociabilis]|uniref:Uncharacterized protein n=1 Tax=Tautonia sociabilis TaxID=2080755 RepID=A0A432MI46_9BACT|nr:hypothetical protein [Tautonia sociabilis]RUL86876.1 hypothetical protein TsocGM_15440 [Tautonia sociabilis]
MARLRIRYPLPGDEPGHWSGELLREGEIPELGQALDLPGDERPLRLRVVALLFRATLAVVGIDADVFASCVEPTSPLMTSSILCSASDSEPSPDSG